MNNNFYDRSNSNQNENSQGSFGGNGYQSYNNNSFSDSNYQSYTNSDNSFGNGFDSSAYNGYAGNSSSYGQNQSNSYDNYSQNSNYQNNQYGYNNTNFNNGYNQNNSYEDNRYVGNSSYQNYGYGNNYNNQYNYNNFNAPNNYQQYLDNSDPVGAEVVYIDENQHSKLPKFFLIVFCSVFILVPLSMILSFIPFLSELIFMLIPILMVSLFVYVGISVLIKPAITSFKKKRRCKQPIVAKIVDVRVTRGSKGSRIYHPCYKYSYKGKIYIIYASSSRGVIFPQVGCTVQMLINKDNPSEYHIESMASDMVSLVMGLIFVLMPLSFIVMAILGSLSLQ